MSWRSTLARVLRSGARGLTHADFAPAARELARDLGHVASEGRLISGSAEFNTFTRRLATSIEEAIRTRAVPGLGDPFVRREFIKSTLREAGVPGTDRELTQMAIRVERQVGRGAAEVARPAVRAADAAAGTARRVDPPAPPREIPMSSGASQNARSMPRRVGHLETALSGGTPPRGFDVTRELDRLEDQVRYFGRLVDSDAITPGRSNADVLRIAREIAEAAGEGRIARDARGRPLAITRGEFDRLGQSLSPQPAARATADVAEAGVEAAPVVARAADDVAEEAADGVGSPLARNGEPDMPTPRPEVDGGPARSADEAGGTAARVADDATDATRRALRGEAEELLGYFDNGNVPFGANDITDIRARIQTIRAGIGDSTPTIPDGLSPREFLAEIADGGIPSRRGLRSVENTLTTIAEGRSSIVERIPVVGGSASAIARMVGRNGPNGPSMGLKRPFSAADAGRLLDGDSVADLRGTFLKRSAIVASVAAAPLVLQAVGVDNPVADIEKTGGFFLSQTFADGNSLNPFVDLRVAAMKADSTYAMSEIQRLVSPAGAGVQIENYLAEAVADYLNISANSSLSDIRKTAVSYLIENRAGPLGYESATGETYGSYREELYARALLPEGDPWALGADEKEVLTPFIDAQLSRAGLADNALSFEGKVEFLRMDDNQTLAAQRITALSEGGNNLRPTEIEATTAYMQSSLNGQKLSNAAGQEFSPREYAMYFRANLIGTDAEKSAYAAQIAQRASAGDAMAANVNGVLTQASAGNVQRQGELAQQEIRTTEQEFIAGGTTDRMPIGRGAAPSPAPERATGSAFPISQNSGLSRIFNDLESFFGRDAVNTLRAPLTQKWEQAADANGNTTIDNTQELQEFRRSVEGMNTPYKDTIVNIINNLG